VESSTRLAELATRPVLYRFTGDGTNGDGAQPFCTPTIDASGNLYGTGGGIGAGLAVRGESLDSPGKEC
jgi:hypothetical protein